MKSPRRKIGRLYLHPHRTRSNRVTSSAVIAVALTCLIQGPAVLAQEEGDGDIEEHPMEDFIITGSRIARRDFYSASPVMTVDRAEIDLSGTTEIKNLLNDLPQVDPGFGAGTNNNAFGSARINLRSLADVRTLVLLNGRRYAPNGIFGTVDLNPLPPVMIERVEIVTGGASAVYGSDAIAGAVNFILRNDFEGLESSLQYDVTEQGDGDTYSLDVAYGTPFADGRGNLAIFGNYYDRSTIFQDARSFSRTPLTSDDDTGEVISNASYISAAGAIDGELGVDFYVFDPDGRPRLFVDPDDRFNWASTNALLAPMERYSANVLGHYDIDDGARVYFEANFAHSAPEQRRSDSFADFVDVNVDRPDITPELANLLSSDFDPDGDGIATILLLKRFTSDTGEAIKINERDFQRAMIGVEGAVGTDWQWSADYSYTSTDLDMRVINDNSVSRIQQGLLVDPTNGACFDTSGGCAPVNPFGEGNLSQAAVDFIALTDTTADEEGEQQVLNVTFRTTPLELSAGDLDVAFGAEYRRDEASLTPSDNILSGDSLFFGAGVASSGVISVREAFAEFRVPLLADAKWAKYLGLDVGARLSDYSTIDKDLWTWKLGGEWLITEEFRLRAMRQRAIRAPNVSELFQDSFFAGFFFGLGPFYDQCSASQDPVGNGLAELCIAQGIPEDQIGVFEAEFFPTEVYFGSNPDLQAEEADTITAGFVWQPDQIEGLVASADFFSMEIDPAVGLIFPTDTVTLCFIVRNPDDQICRGFSRGPSGNISEVSITFLNAALARTKGIDFALEYTWNVDSWALFDGGTRFGASLAGTYYLEAGIRNSPLAPYLDCAGKFGALCNDFVFQGALPDLRTIARFTYQSGPFSASLRWDRIGELINSEAEIRSLTDRPPPTLAVARVSATDYFDLTFEVLVNDHLDISLGVINLLDEQPPFLGAANVDANTDPGTYDILGRRYFLRLTARF